MDTWFVQIGDTHFSPGPRNADKYGALDQIIRETRGRGTIDLPTATFYVPGLGTWFWPGDIFDALSTVEDRNAVDERLKLMNDVAPVIIVYGNHDRKGDLDRLVNIKGRWPIYVVADARVIRVPLPTGQTAAVGCFAYPHKGGIIGAGVAHGDIVQTADALLEPVFINMGQRLAEARAAGDLTAFLFHSNIKGAKLSNGQPNIAREIELSASHLLHLGPIFKGGNHIHYPQEIFGAWFAGSTAPNDYGEKEAKRYLVVSIAPDSSFTVESKPLASLPMYHVDVHLDLGECYLTDADEDVERRFAADDWAGCDLRVRASFNESQRPVLDFEKVKARFASAARFKFETVVIPDRESRSPAVAAARTLPDKLAAMRPDGALPAAERDKVTMLETMDAADVRAAVLMRLSQIEDVQREGVAA